MTTMYQDRPLGALIHDPATEPYWSAAKQGVLRLRRCTACRQPHWYPRPLCPFCLGDTEWVDASGGGTILQRQRDTPRRADSLRDRLRDAR